VSSPVESIWGNPQELLKTPDRLPELAKALGLPTEQLTRKLGQRSDKEFVYLKRRINPDEAQAILAHDIPGVASQREFRRFYPQGEALAHVLGFTNIDDRGQEGVELAFDDWLRGKPGAKKVIRDRRGRIVENVDLVRAAEPGRDLTLSIDRRVQYLTYRELKRALLETGASSVNMTLPARGASILDVEAGAASVNIRVPDTTAARIRVEEGVTAMNVDTTRFPRLNSDLYQSANFDSATDRAEINIEGGLGSITVK
jgi:cell division protein FtsI (penicillin-binding protein 3)